MTVPFKIDLSDKAVVVTGGTGVLGGGWGDALAECEVKVALLGKKRLVEGKVNEIIEKSGTA